MSNAVWTDLRGENAVTGTELKKTGGHEDTPTVSGRTQAISGDGHLQFVIPETDLRLTVGLSNEPEITPDASDFSHCFVITETGIVEVRESGTYKSDFRRNAGDAFQIEIVGTEVRYSAAGTLRYTSHVPIAGPITGKAVISDVNGRVTEVTITTDATDAGAGEGGGAYDEPPAVPMSYDAITDTLVREPAPATPPGPAGSYYEDPAFHHTILRVTDATSHPSSLRTASAPNQMAWNAEGTRFYVMTESAEQLHFRFDRQNFRASLDRKVPFSLESAYPRVMGKPDILYGVRYANGHVVERYDFATGEFTAVLDLKTIDPTLNDSVYTSSLYVSGGPVERCAVNCGGTNQDRHMKLLVFDVNHPSDRRLIDTKASTIDGVPIVDENGNPATMDIYMHSIAISTDGRTVRIDPAGTSAFHWLYNWDLNRFTKVTTHPWGHYVVGWDHEVNEDQGTGPKMQWQLRSLDLAQANAPLQLITVCQSPSNLVKYGSDHTSWHNASSEQNRSAPFFSECQRSGTTDQPDPYGFWSNEIIGIEPRANPTVWRFCHHRMDAFLDDQPGVPTYYYTPMLQVDPLGQFCLFASNWDKTLGTVSAPPAAGAAARVDVFMVKL